MSKAKSFPWVSIGDGMRRRILDETPEAMTVEVELEAGWPLENLSSPSQMRDARFLRVKALSSPQTRCMGRCA